MTPEFIQARINATQALIAAYEEAVLALTTTDIQNYSIDTGQTRQSVTKKDVSRLNEEIDGLYNRLVMLENRLNGGGSTIVRPGW